MSKITAGKRGNRWTSGLARATGGTLRIFLINTGSLDLGVAYSTHVENIGWQPEVANGQTAGTTDQSLRLEAAKIRLTGADADKYSIWYRFHVQNAWQEWWPGYCRNNWSGA